MEMGSEGRQKKGINKKEREQIKQSDKTFEYMHFTNNAEGQNGTYQ